MLEEYIKIREIKIIEDLISMWQEELNANPDKLTLEITISELNKLLKKIKNNA